MTVEPIGIAILLIGLMSLFLEPAFIVSVFVCSTLLGSAAAIVLDSLGGTNIQPAHILLGFLAIRLLSDRKIAACAMHGITIGWPGFWLILTALFTLVSAYLMPRLFAGETFVFPVRSLTPFMVRLEPTTSNLTQSIYFAGDLICFVVIFGYASSFPGQLLLSRAVLGCAVLNLIFVVLDLATYYTGTGELLAFMRNASYAVMSDGEEAGFKRIVGSFTEASSFSYATIGYFGFTSKLWFRNVKPRLTFAVSILLLLALVFSTSTTAYVGIAALLGILFVENCIRVLRGTATKQMLWYVSGAPALTFLVVLVVALNDDWSRSIMGTLDQLILNKMSTSSGVERSSWNTQALQNFKDTLGFGVGNGSLRASSFPMAMIASLGIIGSSMYVMFLVSIWTTKRRVPPADPRESSLQQAARSACLGWLVAACITGAFIDLGLPFFILAALASARPGYFSRITSVIETTRFSRA
jgi:hypothetical protein